MRHPCLVYCVIFIAYCTLFTPIVSYAAEDTKQSETKQSVEREEEKLKEISENIENMKKSVNNNNNVIENAKESVEKLTEKQQNLYDTINEIKNRLSVYAMGFIIVYILVMLLLLSIALLIYYLLYRILITTLDNHLNKHLQELKNHLNIVAVEQKQSYVGKDDKQKKYFENIYRNIKDVIALLKNIDSKLESMPNSIHEKLRKSNKQTSSQSPPSPSLSESLESLESLKAFFKATDSDAENTLSLHNDRFSTQLRIFLYDPIQAQDEYNFEVISDNKLNNKIKEGGYLFLFDDKSKYLAPCSAYIKQPSNVVKIFFSIETEQSNQQLAMRELKQLCLLTKIQRDTQSNRVVISKNDIQKGVIVCK